MSETESSTSKRIFFTHLQSVEQNGIHIFFWKKMATANVLNSERIEGSSLGGSRYNNSFFCRKCNFSASNSSDKNSILKFRIYFNKVIFYFPRQFLYV